MAVLDSPSPLEERVTRDQLHAQVAADAARYELARFSPALGPTDSRFGVTKHERDRLDYEDRRLTALEAIADSPFQVMVEVCTELGREYGETVEKQQLWYANEASFANEVFKHSNTTVAVRRVEQAFGSAVRTRTVILQYYGSSIRESL